jgi:hypothetical protein
MLLEKPYKTGDIISLKLVSGEELVAKFVEESDQTIKVWNPLILSMIQGGQFGLAPYMMTVEPRANFTLKTTSVVCISKTVEDTANSFVEATSGIKL